MVRTAAVLAALSLAVAAASAAAGQDNSTLSGAGAGADDGRMGMLTAAVGAGAGVVAALLANAELPREGSFVTRIPRGLRTLFFQRKFSPHRILGMTFLIQYIASIYLHITDYPRWLQSPLVWSVPLNGFLQSANAALTFTFLPKTEEPGFAAVSDKKMLSYYTVMENSFYAMQLLFACCYLHDDIFPVIRNCVVVEPFFVFFLFYARHLWPSSRISKALTHRGGMTPANRAKLTISTYAIKGFYIFAKHFVGTFPLYLQFQRRLTKDDQHYMYHIEVLGSYAATISMFIHTLKFKGYIGPVTGMLAYDIIIPFYLYLYYNMAPLIMRNSDLAMLTAVGMVLNLAPRPAYFVWQAFVATLFYSGYITPEVYPTTSGQQTCVIACCAVVGVYFLSRGRPERETKKDEAFFVRLAHSISGSAL